MNENSSKRIFGGQHSNGFREKFFHFSWIVMFSVLTLGMWLLILAKKKKSQFHPDVSAVGTTNEIDLAKIDKLVQSAGYQLANAEKPLICINMTGKEFILFTDSNIYYSLIGSEKITATEMSHGKLPLVNAKSIKKKDKLSGDAMIMIGDEIIGRLTNGEDWRIARLFDNIAKDVREGQLE
jgi:hypothetical protein